MARLLLAALLAVCSALVPTLARAQAEQQNLVDRATLAVQEIIGDPPAQQVLNLLGRARAVMICPRLFKAGFIFGGQGGGCVLVARDGAGSWSAPAFYGLGSGSVGFQIGIQDSEMLMTILTEKGLAAVMDDQFKLGADASVAFATIGAGVEGATSTALNADIVAFERARGLFAGASLQGSVLATRTDWNHAYYGQDLAARQIVLQMQASNPGADPLRAVLMRYGSPGRASVQPGYAPPRQGASYPPGPYPAPAPAPSGRVQAAPLPPPR
jgi:lipid-binding SYLF domain-containing protein